MDPFIRCLMEADNDQAMAQCAADAAATRLTADFADVILPDMNDVLTVAAVHGWPEGCAEALLASRQRIGEGQYCDLDRQNCLAYDGRDNPAPWPIVPPPFAEQTDWRSWPALFTPVCWPYGACGFITVQRRDRPFTEADKQNLILVAQQLSLAFAKLRDLNHARQDIAETNLMYRLSALAAQRLSGPEMLQNIARILVEFFRLRHAALALLDADGTSTTVVSNYSSVNDGYDPTGYKIPRDPGSLSDIVLKTGRPLHITDIPNNPLLESVRELMEKRGTQTMLVFPLMMWGEAIGTFGLDIGEKGRVFSKVEQHLLQSVMGQISSLVENVRLQESLEQRAQEAEKLATRDSLTGLYNRRYFFDVAEREFAHARRYGRHLSLIVMDIDDFKQINDQYGHLIGDQLLREAAARMTAVIRAADLLARYGGDEFVLLLPETGRDGALVAAHRLGDVISQPIQIEQGDISVTVSLGVACLSDDHANLPHLLDEADKAMYRHKTANDHRPPTTD
jgi:diguanylate cyclase (GGDEF)-like protein